MTGLAGGGAADGTGPPVRVRIGDAVVARVAARRARAVPGVVALRADLAQVLLGIAGTALGHDTDPLPRAGVSATVDGATARVLVTVVTRLGHNCRDLAREVQVAVAEEVAAYTGLRAVVTVTVADVLLE